MVQEKLYLLNLVNECMERLPADAKGKHSVDWRVEVIRRFSEAALAARPLTSVNMKNPMRIDRVCIFFFCAHPIYSR